MCLICGNHYPRRKTPATEIQTCIKPTFLTTNDRNLAPNKADQYHGFSSVSTRM